MSQSKADTTVNAFDGHWAVYPKSETKRSHIQHKVYPYLLIGMTINEKNQVWVADITYIAEEPVTCVFWQLWPDTAVKYFVLAELQYKGVDFLWQRLWPALISLLNIPYSLANKLCLSRTFLKYGEKIFHFPGKPAAFIFKLFPEVE